MAKIKLTLEHIKAMDEMMNSSEQKRFKSKTWLNGHIYAIQDLNGFNTPYVGYVSSPMDEYNNIITICVFFWTIEISWNGRKVEKVCKTCKHLKKSTSDFPCVDCLQFDRWEKNNG